MFWNKDYFPIEGRSFVISGGSQGVGAALAKEVFARGAAEVVIVARNVEQLKKTTDEISAKRINPDQKCWYISADLSSAEESERVFSQLETCPDVVFCCAGSSKPGLFLDMTAADLEMGVKVNYFTALFFAHAAMKKIAKSPRNKKDPRHIVFFSSVVAFYSFIGYAQYAPMKAAVRSLADTLRQECIPLSTKVECIFPGNTLSEGFMEEELTKPEITKMIEGPSSPISSEDCANIILKKLDEGYEHITTDLIGWALTTVSLGGSPRMYNFLQILLGIFMLILSPVFTWSVNREIRNYFAKLPAVKKD